MLNRCWMGVVVGLFLAAFAVPAAADSGSWPVVTYGSTVEKDTYAWDEQAWVYVSVLASGVPFSPNSEHIYSIWTAPSGAQYLETYDAEIGDRWLGDHLPSPWVDVRESGNWSVNTTWHFNYSGWEGGDHETTTQFQVTPEPATLSLLALGGLALLRRRR